MAESRPTFVLSSSDSIGTLTPPSCPSPEEQFSDKPITSVQSVFAHRFRYFILILGCLCLTSVCSNMIALNFTLICFHKPSDTESLLELHGLNSSIDGFTVQTDIKHVYDHPTYDFTQHEKSMLMYAVAVGSIVGTFPFNYFYARYGARYVFFTAGIMSAISTLLIPKAAEMGFNWFLSARVIQGVAYSADFAAIGVLCVRWASLKQSALFISILTCFSPFSSSITNPVAGALCESRWGWPSVYYVHGSVCFILFVLWIIFYTDHPATHRAVSSTELEKIHRNKSEAHIKMDSFIPYWEIIKNPVILTVWLNALSDIVSGIFLLTYTPLYMNNVLHYSVAHTGILGAIPALSHIPVKLFCGYLSDKIKIIPEYNKMIFFNSMALLVPGIMYLGLGFVPNEQPMIAVLIFIGIHAFLGANCGGFYKCGILVSRQYSAFVVANIQFIKCLTLFIAPGLVAIFVTDESSRDQWRNIFFVLGVVLVFSNTIFFFVATPEPAEFTNLTRENYKKNKKQKVYPADNSIQENKGPETIQNGCSV